MTDVVVAAVVLVALGALIIGLVRWSRGGAPYDDGTGAFYAPHGPEPDDADDVDLIARERRRSGR